MDKQRTLILLVITAITACNPSATAIRDQPLAELEPIEIADTAGLLAGRELEKFSQLAGNAMIVALGESRHDTKEQSELKALLSRSLINDMGFRVVVFEESFSHGLALDAYVTTGQGNIREILNGLAGWYLWDTKEIADVLEWIRQFNERVPSDKMVRVLGMDITAPAAGIRHAIAVAASLDPATDWMGREYGLNLHTGDFWPQTLNRYSQLADDEVSEIRQNLTELSVFLATQATGASSNAEVRLAALEAAIGKRGNEMFSSEGIAQIGAVREAGMTEVVAWIRDYVGAASRMIIWTHNLHAAKSGFRMPDLAEGRMMPMGVLLDEEYGDDYVAIGAAFGTGEFPADVPPGRRSFERLNSETVDGAMSLLGYDSALFDLTGLAPSSPASSWLSQEREWRMQDAMATLSALDGFDAIYYVDRVTRAELTPAALQRYQELEN